MAALAVALLAGPSIARAAGPLDALDAPAFTAPPRALLAAASAADAAGHDAVVLLSESSNVFDPQGRSHRRERLVVSVTNAAGARGWTRWWCDWRPWREERPTLRARVVTADGMAHAIDPRTIEEGGIGEQQEEMYSDGRRLRVPLPAVAAGAVVEQECEYQEKRPAIDGLVQRTHLFGLAVPTERTRLVLDAPRALPLRWVARRLPGLTPRREERGDRVTLTFIAERVIAPGTGEVLLPPDVPPRAYVAWTAVGSWAEVARHYARLVDEKLAEGDLRDVARAATAGRAGREAMIAALLDRVHREVRYTGVELGEGAIVPRPPLETLQRRFGDCKDQATLLVGLLRASGIDARVALLRAGLGFDVERELPDLGSFNHAIVFVPGTPPIWIDPTSRHARAGQLPIQDQGRWALVAGGDGKLLQTPTATSKDNSDIEERQILLPESGKARVIETGIVRGTLEVAVRARAAGRDDSKLREFASEYLKGEYGAATLDRMEMGDPDDLGKPVRMHLEGSEAQCGVSDPDSVEGAAVAIAVWRIAAPFLPEVLRQEESDEKGAGRGEHKAIPVTRISDVYLPQPVFVEWRYRVVPPPGYKPHALPAAERRLLGQATFTREFREEPGGVIAALFRFDTGSRRRLSVDEARGLRDGVVKLRKEGDLILRFVHRGQEALAAGRVADALDEFRRLAALHPKEALHHDQMAQALLRVGLGDAARAEARRGVELEPASAEAHKALAMVLEHDLFGRHFHAGFDRAGAEAELKRARQLDPKNALVRAELARLHCYDADGLRYGSRARLDEAVREYRALESDLDEKRFRTFMLLPLFHARRFDELKREARSHEPSDARNLLLVAGIAATDGAHAALEEAGRLESDPARLRSLVTDAAEKLVALRFYPESAALFERAAQGLGDNSQAAERARFMRKVRKVDPGAVSKDDPIWPVRELFLRLGGGDPARVNELFAVPADADEVSASPRRLQRAWRHIANGLPEEVVADLSIGAWSFTASGDKAVGFRVRVAYGAAGEAEPVYVIPARAGSLPAYRILAEHDTLWPIGRRALELVTRPGKPDLEGARRWLDWAREEVRGGEDDPVANRPFALFWTRGQSGSADEIRAAAAALLVEEKSTAATAIPLLVAERDKAAPEQRFRHHLALVHAFAGAQRWEDMLVAAEGVAAREPDSEALFWQRQLAFQRLGRWGDAEKLASARLDRFKDDPAALRALASAAGARRDFAAERRLLKRVIDAGSATPNDYNQSAWVALYVDPLDAAALDLARQGVERSGRKRYEILHTLATLQAEAGRTGEACQTLLESLVAADVDEPRPHDWYVLGRIADHLGIRDAALPAYRRAAAAPDRAEDTLSVAWLADRRLASLSGPSAPAAAAPGSARQPATSPSSPPAGRKSK